MSPNSKNASLDLLVRIGVLFILMLFLFPVAQGSPTTGSSEAKNADLRTSATLVDLAASQDPALGKLHFFNGLGTTAAYRHLPLGHLPGAAH